MQVWIKHTDTGQQVHMPTAILVLDGLLSSLRKNAEEIDGHVFGNIMRDQPPHEVFEGLLTAMKDTMEAVAEFPEDIERVNNEDGS